MINFFSSSSLHVTSREPQLLLGEGFLSACPSKATCWLVYYRITLTVFQLSAVGMMTHAVCRYITVAILSGIDSKLSADDADSGGGDECKKLRAESSSQQKQVAAVGFIVIIAWQ